MSQLDTFLKLHTFTYCFVIVERKFVGKRKGSAFVRWAIGGKERVNLVARASESALVGVGGDCVARRWRGEPSLSPGWA